MKTLLLLVLLALSVEASIFVQSSNANAAPAATSKAFTVAAGANGNTLFLCITSAATTVAPLITSISQTNVIWTGTLSTVYGISPLLKNSEMWVGIPTGATGTTLTVTWDRTVTSSAFTLMEFTTVDATNNFDTANSNSGLGTAAPVPATTTAFINELFVTFTGFADTAAPAALPGGNYVNLPLSSSTLVSVKAAYSVVNTPGVQTPTWTLTNSVRWSTQFYALPVPNYSSLTLLGAGPE